MTKNRQVFILVAGFMVVVATLSRIHVLTAGAVETTPEPPLARVGFTVEADSLEWLTFPIAVPQSGRYQARFRTAGPADRPGGSGVVNVGVYGVNGRWVENQTVPITGGAGPGDIVFVSTRDGNPEIYSVNADGTNLTRLTNNPANDDAPVWSPDRERIAFASDRDGSPEIYVMNADGTDVVRRTFSASHSGDPCWSADGHQIVYSTLSNGSLNIWTVSPDSGSPALLLEKPGYDAHPALSPDGSRLAVTSDWYAYDFVHDIFIANADGTGWTGLTGEIFDHLDYVRPSWSPDSATLAVAITRTTGVNQYITQLGVMHADGSGLTPLISAATWAKSSWSPDGTMIAFTSESSGGLNISWVSVTDGSQSGTIVTNGYSPDWGMPSFPIPGAAPAPTPAPAPAPTPAPAPAPNAPPAAATSCTTIKPGPDWSCVNGGWLPPGFPIFPGVPVSLPALPPPTGCSTPDPFVSIGGGICVAGGGWIPRGMR